MWLTKAHTSQEAPTSISGSSSRTLLDYGYGDILEARIQYANVENHPERQFRVVVKIKDNRKQ